MAIDFVAEMRASAPDDPESLYYRANNRIKGVLVVAPDFDASTLIRDCFDANFPITMEALEDDPDVPRLETISEQYVGNVAIRAFLSNA